jgi:L-rhamnose-H+ transport protein
VDLFAIVLIVIAGLTQATFVVPMKAIRNWEWENVWFVFTFLGFVILPAALALLTIPSFSRVLAAAPRESLLAAALFGIGWGAGSVCFGLGVKMLGVGVGFSIVAGLSSALGSLIPWFTSPAKAIGYSVLLWLGVLVMLGGIVVCAVAGHQRDKVLGQHGTAAVNRKHFSVALTICIVGGILSSFINLGFAYGAAVTKTAESFGATVANAPNVLWLVIMTGGFVTNGIYCGSLMVRKGTWRNYVSRSVANMSLALLMGLLWVITLAAYGAGGNMLGRLGPIVGWPILMSVSLIASNLWGVVTGEWRGAGERAGRTMAYGIGVLLVAVVIFGWTSSIG